MVVLVNVIKPQGWSRFNFQLKFRSPSGDQNDTSEKPVSIRHWLVVIFALGTTTLPTGAQQNRETNGPVSIPGGTFLMGSEAAAVPELRVRYAVTFPNVFENEVPAHKVTVADFRMDPDEVTNARFSSFLDANPEWHQGTFPAARHNGRYLEDWVNGGHPAGKANHPVVFVTWHAAQAFCLWAGGRLPSEAEWEYAARSGGDAEFPWGAGLPSPELANYSASGNGATVAVGSYPPTEWGLHDLAGNVWELLLDPWEPRYRESARDTPVGIGPMAGRAFLSIEGRRALRGASFGRSVVNLRTRWRDSHIVTNAVEFVGFRCAYPATGERRDR